MEKTLEAVATPTSVQTLAGFAVVAVVAEGPRFIAFIDNKIHQYSEKNRMRFGEIRKSYIQNCYENEKNSSLCTVSIEQVKASTTEFSYPDYFQYHEESLKSNYYFPKLFYSGYRPVIEDRLWHSQMNKRSELLLELQDLISFICEFQTIRDKTLNTLSLGERIEQLAQRVGKWWDGDSAFYYDPINMFCEELKCWLVNFSNSELNAKAIKDIDVRARYINELHTNRTAFTQPEVDIKFISFLDELRQSLVVLKPLIEMVIARRSAREYFYDIKLSTRSLLRSVTEFLFYFTSRSANIPENFTLRQLCLSNADQLPTYKETLNTRFGKILSYLVKNSGIARIFPVNTLDRSLQKYEKRPLVYHFSNERGQFKYPTELTGGTVHQNSWWVISKDDDREALLKEIGILEEFLNKETVENLLILCSLIEKITFFHQVCEDMYDLAGDMGNLSLFGCAAQHVTIAMESFSQVMAEFTSRADTLNSYARNFYKKSESNKGPSKNKCITQWLDISYKHISRSISDIQKNYEEIANFISNLQAHIRKVNHPAYAEEVKRRIADTIELIRFISGHTPVDLNQPLAQQDPKAIPPKSLPRARFFNSAAEPGTPKTLAIQGNEYYQAGEFSQAVCYFRSTLLNDPDNIESARNLCISYARLKEFPDDYSLLLDDYFSKASSKESEITSEDYLMMCWIAAQYCYSEHDLRQAQGHCESILRHPKVTSEIQQKAIKLIEIISQFLAQEVGFAASLSATRRK